MPTSSKWRPVVGAEERGAGGAGVDARLLVEDRDVAQIDAAVGERGRQQLAVGAAGELAGRAGEEAPLGQQLAPDRGRQERGAGRRRLGPADGGHAARPAVGVAGDRHRRRRVEDGADPLEELVDQLLLGALPLERERQVVERLELEDAPLLGKVGFGARHAPSLLPG